VIFRNVLLDLLYGAACCLLYVQPLSSSSLSTSNRNCGPCGAAALRGDCRCPVVGLGVPCIDSNFSSSASSSALYVSVATALGLGLGYEHAGSAPFNLWLGRDIQPSSRLPERGIYAKRGFLSWPSNASMPDSAANKGKVQYTILHIAYV